MKLKEFSKIGLAAFVTALTIIIVSMFGFNASAEDTESVPTPAPLDIAYCNLSFENEVHLMYAVKLNAANVKLLVWEEAQSAYTIGTQTAILSPLSAQMEIDGEMYTIFEYTGLSAKQMTDNVYARAYIDGTEEYGAPHKYSILQYVYNKLGKTGNASTNDAFKNMLTEMLNYGAATQLYQNYRTDTLATDDFAQIKLEGGTLPDGFSYGLYKVGSSLTITAPETDADGAGFVEWVDENGNAVADTATAEITVGETNITYTAVYTTSSYSEGLEYTRSSDGTYYSVTGIGTCTDTDVVIPPTHESLPIKAIGDSAFYGCTELTSIIIPDSVISIGNAAFDGYTGLTSVTIGNGVTSIGDYAFRYCSGLTSVTIPNSVTSIGSQAFYHCTGITEVHISDIEVWCNIDFNDDASNPLYYAKNLYLNGSLITELVIPHGVTEIPVYAFYYQSSLTSVTIPDSVTSIGGAAFSYCNKLTSITIPDSVTSIGRSAFYECTELTSITIPDSVTSIGSNAFKCTGLTSVTIPGSVLSLGSNTFDGCSKLTNVTIGIGVTRISYGMFYCCGGLTSVTIPGSVTSIDGSAFYECAGLTNVTIPDSVTSIAGFAFYNCSGLTSITIPSNVTSIGNYAFQGCSKLTSVTFENPNGWFITSSSSVTSGTSVDVTDSATNATDLRSTYRSYSWKRSE